MSKFVVESNLVLGTWKRGQVVAGELFKHDLQRLLDIGAVRPAADHEAARDVIEAMQRDPHEVAFDAQERLNHLRDENQRLRERINALEFQASQRDERDAIQRDAQKRLDKMAAAAG